MTNLDVSQADIAALVNGDHAAPFDVLGPHPAGEDGQHVSLRVFRPSAASLTVIDQDTSERFVMQRKHDAGLFEITVNRTWPGWRYQLEATNANGQLEVFVDPFAFAPTLTDFDLHLVGEGTHLYTYDVLGAHQLTLEGVPGVRFAVWAPNAYRVNVVGGFNTWDGRIHPMRYHANVGIWELFIPGLEEGNVYKYEVRSRFNDYRALKSDPYGFASEQRPQNASIVVDLDRYDWQDAAWMEARASRNVMTAPLSIYEVHLGSWRRRADGSWLTYRELAPLLVEYAQQMNFTHLEFMPVAEHPLDESWGYQITGYFAPTSRYGKPEDFMFLVDYCHQNGLAVILDWVPAHFPRDEHGLGFFDGTHLYEHADPNQGEHPDWGTYIFNYGRNEVRNFLLSNALFWLRRYHIDGLRVDAVSSMLYLDFSRKAGQWVPNKYGGRENLDAVTFLQEVNAVVHRECPGTVMIAEESTSWPMVSRPTYLGGLGFTFKWNMGWMHDTLDYMKTDPLYRRFKHDRITFSLAYAFSENFILSLSHDEVVHLKGSLINKMAGDWWQKLASLRLLFGYQYTHPGKKLIFMGQEIGQWREWTEDRALDWDLLKWPTHAQLQKWVSDLNWFYQAQPALYEHDYDLGGYQWIEVNDTEQSVFSYLRYADNPDNFLVIVGNFTPIPRFNYRIGVPKPGRYVELLNSDSELYGGTNLGNMGAVTADQVSWHAWPHSLSLTIPPLALLVFKLEAAQS